MLPSPEYERQVHYAASDWDGVLLDGVPKIDIPISFFKPAWGFWTSTDPGNGTSPWKDLTLRIRSRSPNLYKLFHFEVVGSPNILVIEDDNDVLALMGKLSIKLMTFEDALVHAIDNPDLAMTIMSQALSADSSFNQAWNWLADNYDAVHVPEYHSRAGYLNSWDVESTVWFKPASYLRLVG